MKLLFPVLLVLVAGFFLVRSCTRKKDAGSSEAASNPVTELLPTNLASRSRRGETGPEAPIVTQHYRFKHRDLPQAFLELREKGSKSDGLTVIIDDASATVAFIGPLDLVARWRQTAEALDLMPSTAYAKCWVFWVSRANSFLDKR